MGEIGRRKKGSKWERWKWEKIGSGKGDIRRGKGRQKMRTEETGKGKERYEVGTGEIGRGEKKIGSRNKRNDIRK